MDLLGTILVGIGMPFFISGTIGLLRFPDIYTRLHALTKADNVGLFFVIIGLAMQSDSYFEFGKLILIWVLILIASSASCHLIARSARQKGIQPWKRP